MKITEKDRKTLDDLYWTVVKLGLGGNTVREHVAEIVKEMREVSKNMKWIGCKK